MTAVAKRFAPSQNKVGQSPPGVSWHDRLPCLLFEARTAMKMHCWAVGGRPEKRNSNRTHTHTSIHRRGIVGVAAILLCVPLSAVMLRFTTLYSREFTRPISCGYSLHLLHSSLKGGGAYLCGFTPVIISFIHHEELTTSSALYLLRTFHKCPITLISYIYIYR